MTLFIVLVLAASLAWLGWEGWQWYGRAAEARQAGRAFSAEVAQRSLRQEVDQLRVLFAAQQQQLATLQEEVAQLKRALTAASSSSGAGEGITRASGAGQGAAVAATCEEPSRTVSGQPPRDQADGVSGITAVSPEYAEPLALARRGLDPEALVARCGVTMAEAQLIWALAQSAAASHSQAHAPAI